MLLPDVVDVEEPVAPEELDEPELPVLPEVPAEPVLESLPVLEFIEPELELGVADVSVLLELE